jgi:hypothetical protein
MTFTLPRNAELWLPAYLRHQAATWLRRSPDKTIDVLLCVADHYEPDHGGASMSKEIERVQRWSTRYPALADSFRDADGRPPQHTFFFPADGYRPAHLDRLAQLCQAGYGEVEVHLHHGHDTSAKLRDTLEQYRDTLASRHGLLSTDRGGRTRYAFIHGNWALDNGGIDASTCGVNDELTILRETGCYADLTMPAAPNPAQSRIVNKIYYAVDDPERPRSYDTGVPSRVHGTPPAGSLLLVQGPLALTWRSGRLLPGLENGALDESVGHQPTVERFRTWVSCGISVAGRPEWVMIKIYTHGAPEPNAEVLLGSAMKRFHEQIGREFNDGRRYRLHYVTARELVNIVRAAEDGKSGNPNAFRDYELVSRIRPPTTSTAELLA